VIHRIAVGILLIFGVGGIVIGLFALLGLARVSQFGNTIVVGVGAILNGFVITRFALRQARIRDRTA
jgi:hypothetical protein